MDRWRWGSGQSGRYLYRAIHHVRDRTVFIVSNSYSDTNLYEGIIITAIKLKLNNCFLRVEIVFFVWPSYRNSISLNSLLMELYDAKDHAMKLFDMKAIRWLRSLMKILKTLPVLCVFSGFRLPCKLPWGDWFSHRHNIFANSKIWISCSSSYGTSRRHIIAKINLANTSSH